MDKNKIFPADFDGVFSFSNDSDEEFRARWNKVEYVFPPRSETKLLPSMFPENSPVQIQAIRKRFAYDWAQREILKSEAVKKMNEKNVANQMVKAHNALTYAPKDLEPYVQKCLKPLAPAELKTEKVEVRQPELSEGNRIISNAAVQDPTKPATTDQLVVNGLAEI